MEIFGREKSDRRCPKPAASQPPRHILTSQEDESLGSLGLAKCEA